MISKLLGSSDAPALREVVGVVGHIRMSVLSKHGAPQPQAWAFRILGTLHGPQEHAFPAALRVTH